MRVRRVAALAVPLTVLACGGPTAPTPAILDLVPGAYLLTLTMSEHGDPVCAEGNPSVCVTFSFCGGAGAPPTPAKAATVVHLERSDDAVDIRPEDPSATFRLGLQVTGKTLAGTASGEFRAGALSVFVGPGGNPSAVATGTVLTTSVTGKIDGQVSIGGYGCSNNGRAALNISHQRRSNAIGLSIAPAGFPGTGSRGRGRQ